MQTLQPPPCHDIDPSILQKHAVQLRNKPTSLNRTGQGSFGSVYKVNVNGTDCIGKRLHDILLGRGQEEQVSLQQREKYHTTFVRECVLLSQAQHPNVVKFIGVHFGSTRFDLTLCMEKLHTDLQKYIEGTPNIPLLTKVFILHNVSCGLLYLHEKCSIIHRDLTAANILLTADNRAKIADLGVSRIYHRSFLRLTKQPGTPGYMPPEALKDTPDYNESIDIFSFGVLILYLIIQEFPEFVWENVPDTIMAKHEGEIYKRQKWIDKLDDPEVKAVIVWCLCDTPLGRPTALTLNTFYQEMKKDAME